MLAWLRSLVSGRDAEELEMVLTDRLPEEVEGLNFRTAIEAHLKWKGRLADFVAGRSREPIDIEALSRDDKCVLGQWIHSRGKARHGTEPVFLDLRTAHAAFHRAAGEVAKAALDGKRDQALEMLNTGPYARASMQVVRQLAVLWRQVG